MPTKVVVIGIPGIRLIRSGDDVGEAITASLRAAGLDLFKGDVLVVAQSIVSRSEGSIIMLDSVTPSRNALVYADITGKDPRVVEIVLRESKHVIWASKGFMICETRHGFVCANAGVDVSNIDEGWVSTLPRNPDASARSIAESIKKTTGIDVPVIVSDSEGRPFRRGAVGVAIGVHGLSPVRSLVGTPDLFGRKLETTEVGTADLICSSAALVMGEAAEGIPAVIVRGADFKRNGGIGDIFYEKDIFKKEMLKRKRE